MYFETNYTHKIVRKATSATTFTIKLPKIDHGDKLTIDAVSVMIDAHKTKYVDVGFIQGSTVHLMETLAISQNNQAFSTKNRVSVPTSFRPFIRIVSPTSGVIYTINIFGSICWRK